MSTQSYLQHETVKGPLTTFVVFPDDASKTYHGMEDTVFTVCGLWVNRDAGVRFVSTAKRAGPTKLCQDCAKGKRK